MLVDVADPLEDDEARELGKVDVEDDEIGTLAPDGLDRGLAVVGPHDVVALAAQCVVKQLHQVAVVIDDQELHYAPASSASCRALGSVKCTEVPRPTSLSTRISPP